MKRILILSALLPVCLSCGGQSAKKTTAAADAPQKEYSMPAIPKAIVDPEAQVRWAVEHYWDDFNFADTLSVAGWGDYAEQAFVNFDYHLLAHLTNDMADKAIGGLFTKATENRDIFLKFGEVAEKYLFDANSPYRNEEFYISALRAQLAAPVLDEWERVRPAEQLRMALKNRVGEPAADFRYTLASGATGSLHTFRARFTLLFFNNPGCPACREMMEGIGASPYLSRLIESGEMRVLAVYPDADLAAWRDYASKMPAAWINACDAGESIKNGELYDLKAIPTLYLLDADKRVMLKDVMSVDAIESTINNTIER
jgi:thiol-disulfide isomerase/thioredoxin